MKQWIRRVVIADDANTYYSDGECEICGRAIWARFPVNYPQVCHDCADKYVWHYCNRIRKSQISTAHHGQQTTEETKRC